MDRRRVTGNDQKPVLRGALKLDHVYHGDALKVLNTLPDNSVDAIISDPPFFTGIGRNDGGFGEDPWNDIGTVQAGGIWATSYMEQFNRIVKKGGAIALMCGCHASAMWMIAAENAGVKWMAEIDILWNTGKPRRQNFGSLHTHCLWFVRPGAKHTWNSNRKAFFSNVIVATKVSQQNKRHVSQKPIELTNFLVTLLTKPNTTVLDPFCGSGSTLVSADLAGRNYVGIDKEAGNVKISKDRAMHSSNEEENPLYFWVNGRLEEI